MSKVQTVTYVEDFHLDLTSSDALRSYAIKVKNNVLRGFNKLVSLDTRNDYMGIAGVNGDCLFVFSNRSFRKYDGEKFSRLIGKAPFEGNLTSADARHDIYRDVAYLAFDADGILLHKLNSEPQSFRWAFSVSALDVAVVNERLAVLTDNGSTIRFAPCGQRLYSDAEIDDGEIAPAITLPSRVQAIKRFNNNTLYALGQTCYKLTFSANERDIKVVTVADGLDKVVQHSVAVVGNAVLFATETGMYKLVNDKVKPVFGGLSKVVDNFKDCNARAYRGKYALSVPFGQGRVVYVLDVESGKCEAILQRDVKDVCVYNGLDAVVTADGVLAQAAPNEYAPSRFVRSNVDFCLSGSKYLRNVDIVTKYDVELTVTNEDGVKRALQVKGSDKMQRLRVYLKGGAFRLEVGSSGQTEVSYLALTAQTYKEVKYGN